MLSHQLVYDFILLLLFRNVSFVCLSIYLKFVHSFVGRRTQARISCIFFKHSFCLKHAF